MESTGSIQAALQGSRAGLGARTPWAISREPGGAATRRVVRSAGQGASGCLKHPSCPSPPPFVAYGEKGWSLQGSYRVAGGADRRDYGWLIKSRGERKCAAYSRRAALSIYAEKSLKPPRFSENALLVRVGYACSHVFGQTYLFRFRPRTPLRIFLLIRGRLPLLVARSIATAQASRPVCVRGPSGPPSPRFGGGRQSLQGSYRVTPKVLESTYGDDEGTYGSAGTCIRRPYAPSPVGGRYGHLCRPGAREFRKCVIATG